MGLYALDALVFALISAWLAVGFHAFALWGLWRGLQATNALVRLEKDGLIPSVVQAQ